MRIASRTKLRSIRLINTQQHSRSFQIWAVISDLFVFLIVNSNCSGTFTPAIDSPNVSKKLCLPNRQQCHRSYQICFVTAMHCLQQSVRLIHSNATGASRPASRQPCTVSSSLFTSSTDGKHLRSYQTCFLTAMHCQQQFVRLTNKDLLSDISVLSTAICLANRPQLRRSCHSPCDTTITVQDRNSAGAVTSPIIIMKRSTTATPQDM